MARPAARPTETVRTVGDPKFDAPTPGQESLPGKGSVTNADAPVAIVHPGTGELIENLKVIGTEPLADLMLAVRDKLAALKEIEHLASDEIRHRMKFHDRAVWVVGNYGIECKPINRSVWDWDELDGVLRQLVDDGVLHAGECTGVIRKEIKGSAREADRLAKRLDGKPRRMVEGCRVWEQKPGRVEVVRQVQLLEGTQ